MSDGAYALIGVLVGGFLNAAVSMLNDWRARRRQRRSVARLLLARLSQAVRHFEPGLVLGMGSLGPFTGRESLVSYWMRYEDLFASTLSPDKWTTLVAGIDSALKLSDLEGRSASDLDKKIFKVYVKQVKDAELVLAELAGTGKSDVNVQEKLMQLLAEEVQRRETSNSGGTLTHARDPDD